MLTLKHNLTALLLSVLVVTSAFLVVVIPQPIKTKAQTTIPDWNFGMGGDWACTSNTRATVSGMVNRGIELNLGLGDYSYQSSAQCWFDIIRPIDSKTKISIGNHDDTSKYPSLLNQYMSHFGLSSQYYSFNYQNTHFTVISTEQSTSSGSSQYNFVNNDLSKAAADPNIKWKVVYFHKPIYTSPSNHEGETTTRSAMHPLFDKYGVDLVLTGHNHNFQRTYPLKYNSANSGSPTITDSNKNTYTDPAGQIYALVGTAGTNLYSLNGQASYVVYQQDDQFGWMNVEMLNSGTTMKGTYYTNDGVARDTWTINKPSSTPTNQPPAANAGPDQTVAENTAGVTLNGGTSTDSDGTIASYSWVQTAGSPTVTLTGANTATPTFTAPSVTATTTLTFRLTVTDNSGATATDDVNVVVTDSGGGGGGQTTKYTYAPYATLSGSNYTQVSSSTSLQLTTFSVASWFKTSTDFASNAFIVNKGGSGSDTSGQNMNYGISMSTTENIIAEFETRTGADHFITSPNRYNDGQWHYAVATYDGTTTLRLYIDGVQVASKSTAGAVPDNTGTQPVRIGANSRTLNQYFTGNADEVRVWNRALTAQEVSDQYNNGIFNTNGQVLYLNFGTSNTATNQPLTANAGPDQTVPVSYEFNTRHTDPTTMRNVIKLLYVKTTWGGLQIDH